MAIASAISVLCALAAATVGASTLRKWGTSVGARQAAGIVLFLVALEPVMAQYGPSEARAETDGKQLSRRLFLKVDAGLCALTGGSASADLGQTLGVSLDYRFDRRLLGSLSSAPSTNGAACANQAAGRGTALVPRQWGLDFSRVWRF